MSAACLQLVRAWATGTGRPDRTRCSSPWRPLGSTWACASQVSSPGMGAPTAGLAHPFPACWARRSLCRLSRAAKRKLPRGPRSRLPCASAGRCSPTPPSTPPRYAPPATGGGAGCIGKLQRLGLFDVLHDLARCPRVPDVGASCRLGTCAQASAGQRAGSAGTKSGQADLQGRSPTPLCCFCGPSQRARRACQGGRNTPDRAKRCPAWPRPWLARSTTGAHGTGRSLGRQGSTAQGAEHASRVPHWTSQGRACPAHSAVVSHGGRARPSVPRPCALHSGPLLGRGLRLPGLDSGRAGPPGPGCCPAPAPATPGRMRRLQPSL
jgi:hypothetical protein